MNKILIVVPEEKERLLLAQALEDFIEEGGEIFFAEKINQALEILDRERPKLVFVDESAVGSDEGLWQRENTSVVLLARLDKGGHSIKKMLIKPLQPDKIHYLCEQIFGKGISHPSLPPM